MITVKNYQKETKNIDFKSLPEALQSGHKNFNTMAEHYDSNAKIKEVLDNYIEKLNQTLICDSTDENPKKEKKVSTKKSSKSSSKPKSPKKDSLVIKMMLAISRTPASRISFSMLKIYSNAAP